MHDYKCLPIAVMICATLNTDTDTQTTSNQLYC